MATNSSIYGKDFENSSGGDQVSGDVDRNSDDDVELQLSDDHDCHQLTDGDSNGHKNQHEVGT